MKINLYEQLATELAGLIAERIYAPGERLPSIRHLADQKRLSISTVMQALRLLEDRGLIDARPQAGYFVRHRAHQLTTVASVENPKEPLYVGITNSLMRVCQANEAPGVVQLGSAWPPDELLPTRRIQQLVGTIVRRSPELLSTVSCYGSNEPNFIRQVIRRALDWGSISGEEIVVTTSCTEALQLCLRAVTKPGDTIAIESATYFVLLQLIESMGLKALEIPTDPCIGLSVDALELALDAGLVTACLFIPNVNNPLGCVMPEANKKRVAELLSKHGIPLIEDDIYSDLHFSQHRPWPIKAYDTSGHVMMCSSFSKAVSPAARVGYVVAGRYTEQVSLLKTISSGATSPFFQAVLAEFIGTSSYDKQLRKMRRTMEERVARMSDGVATFFPSECRVSEPQGGFVLWVQLPEQVNAMALHEYAIARRVAFMPGQLFSGSGKYVNYLRLNCCNGWTPEIIRGVQRLGELVHQAADADMRKRA